MVENDLRMLSCGELSALCTNLQKACTKQLRDEEAALFGCLAAYYGKQCKKPVDQADYQTLLALINEDLASGYAQANEAAAKAKDRGAMRSLVWGEKVSKLLKSLLIRYEKQKHSLLEHTNVYVCEICGFVYVGDQPPEICPICKVPKFKIQLVQKEVM